MAKVSRSVLKQVVKECLIEILFEGIDSEGNEDRYPLAQMSEGRRQRKPKSKRAPKRPALDKIKFNSAVEESVDSLTADPVMSQIFQDTARTTLQEQYAASERSPSANAVQSGQMADSSARLVNDNGIDDLFEGADKWADLAFASPTKPR